MSDNYEEIDYDFIREKEFSKILNEIKLHGERPEVRRIYGRNEQIREKAILHIIRKSACKKFDLVTFLKVTPEIYRPLEDKEVEDLLSIKDYDFEYFDEVESFINLHIRQKNMKEALKVWKQLQIFLKQKRATTERGKQESQSLYALDYKKRKKPYIMPPLSKVNEEDEDAWRAENMIHVLYRQNPRLWCQNLENDDPNCVKLCKGVPSDSKNCVKLCKGLKSDPKDCVKEPPFLQKKRKSEVDQKRSFFQCVLKNVMISFDMISETGMEANILKLVEEDLFLRKCTTDG